jgi:hypothetical protein
MWFILDYILKCDIGDEIWVELELFLTDFLIRATGSY